MGHPVKIVELARRMIILSGMKPEGDIKIEFTGLRPGEKMYEELFTPAEDPVGTSADGVIAGSPPTYPIDKAREIVDRINSAIASGDVSAGLAELVSAVPEATVSDHAALHPKDNVVQIPRVVRQS
jgi:Predicted nucleoside-diphosphate sugar epimerases